MIRIRFLGTRSPGPFSFNSFPSLHRFSRWSFLVQQVCPDAIGKLSILQVQIGRATCLLSVPRKGRFFVSSLVGCTQVLLDTSSCCGNTKQFDQAFRRRWARLRADPIQFPFQRGPDCFFLFGTRQMYTSSLHWNSTCFRFRHRSSSKIRRCERVCKCTFSAPVMIYRFCSVVIGSVLPVASVFHTGRRCANVHCSL